MPATSYDINFAKPCGGTITVNQISPTLYSGAGPLGVAVLNAVVNGGTTTWFATLYASSQSSPCNPSRVFEQRTPDADPPGDYAVDPAPGQIGARIA